jgi:hypothetical protein
MKYFIIVCTLLFVAYTSKAQDTVTVIIQNKDIVSSIIPAEQFDYNIFIPKKLVSKKGQWVIRVQSKWINHQIYKKLLEIETDTSTIVAMQLNKPGYFDISKTKTALSLKAGKTVKFYLLLSPANPRMKIANRRVYLGSFALN